MLSRTAMSLFALLLFASAQAAPDAGPGYWNVASAPELIQAAAAMPTVGGTIVLRPGAYVLDAPLRFSKTNHVNLIGSGWDTTIQRRGAGDAIVFADCSFCVVRDLLINGDIGAAEGSGIVYHGQSGSCTVTSCRISSFAESAVRYDGDPKVPQSSNSVRDCQLIDNGGDQIASHYNNDFYIEGNQFGAHGRSGAGAPRTGALLDHSAAGTYTRNYHWGNRVALRVGAGSHFNRIENNRFEQSRETGILIGDPAGREGVYLCILLGNTIHTNSEGTPGAFPAVEAHHAHDFTFCANQAFSWDSATVKHSSALVLGAGCDGWIVKDNILRHCKGPALVYDDKSGHIVKDNITD